MIEKLLDFSIRHRWLVLLGALALGALGVFNYARLPIDAVPDITNVQVQINTSAPGYSPLEVGAAHHLPDRDRDGRHADVDYTRSISRYGLSQVTVVFKDGTDIYLARQQVAERLQEAQRQLPPGIEPQMGPISTGLGEIYMWTVDAKPGAKKPDGSPLHADRPARDPGLGRSSRSCATCPASPRSTPSAASRSNTTSRPIRGSCRLWAQLPRRDRSAGEEQRERRRGLHRAQRRAISDPRARPGARHVEDIRGIVVASRRGRADSHPRCRQRSRWAGIAHRRGHAQRPRSACSARRSC